MTDKNLLKYYTARQELNLSLLAERIGISESALYRKVNGDSEFKINEIKQIKEILKLNNDETFRVFFNENLTFTQEN